MRIYIKRSNGRNFSIPVPIGFIKVAIGFGGFGISIARKYVPEDQRKYFDNIDFRELEKGFDVLKAYKGLKMVEVKSGDGTEVTIII